MAKEKIIISGAKLAQIIKEAAYNAINESRMGEIAEYNGHKIHIATYMLKDPEDRDFITKNIDTIWDILTKGYENIGGFKGFQSKKDILKKSPMIKLGFFDDEIVAVDVFNGYLGGNKSVGITCVKNENHEPGVMLVEMIIKENINNWNDWVWCEVSGKIEELYKKNGGLQISDIYLPIFLTKRYTLVGDGYHYYHTFPDDNKNVLSEKEKNLRVKCIFGLKDQDTYDIMLEDAYGPLLDFIDRVNNNKLNENKVYDRYFSKKSEIEQSKMIIDRFIEMVENEKVYELPPILYQEFYKRLVFLNNAVKNDTCPENIKEYVIECIENGKSAFDKVNILEPIAVGYNRK